MLVILVPLESPYHALFKNHSTVVMGQINFFFFFPISLLTHPDCLIRCQFCQACCKVRQGNWNTRELITRFFSPLLRNNVAL